ncbi:hypothetical protein MMC2321_02917 [Chitinophaga sp. MM2321]
MEISSIQEYLTEVKDLYKQTNAKKHFFFRGHADLEYQLWPSVLRGDGYDEKELLLDFKQYGRRHHVDYNYQTERDKLLVEMQHYEIPTRLLDWSVAPLTALFFACKHNVNQKTGEATNGEIVILNTWKYWPKAINGKKGVHPEIHQINITARSLLASGWNYEHIAKYIEKTFGYADLATKDLELPFPYVACFTNDRIYNQHGCFTIHGTSEIPMDELAKDYLHRIQIPANCKASILEHLNMLYINDYSVYPDFEGMSKTIKAHKGLFNL